MLDKTNLFNSHNSFVNNIFCIFAAIFCISYVETQKILQITRTKYGFHTSRTSMNNLLNSGLLASCMQRAERHNSIEDQWKLVYWFFNAVIHITTLITREASPSLGKPKYVPHHTLTSYFKRTQIFRISRIFRKVKKQKSKRVKRYLININQYKPQLEHFAHRNDEE